MTVTFEVGEYGYKREVPMTSIFEVSLYQYYEWDEGHLFRHDETGLYAWVQDSGCSCFGYLERVSDDVDDVSFSEFTASLEWAPLDRIVPAIERYIDSDDGRYDENGPAWRTEQRARLHLLVRTEGLTTA